MFSGLRRGANRAKDWLFGSFADEAAAEIAVESGKKLFKRTIREQVVRGTTLLQLAFFPDLTQDDESAFEVVKKAVRKEMRACGFTGTEASQMMEDFDTFLERDLLPWQAKILRYTVVSQKEEQGRLDILLRFFDLNPDEPGSLTIPVEKRKQIMRNIASEEPLMMMLGRKLRESAPKAWEFAKKLGLNTPQFGTFVYLGAVSGVESAWHYYVTVMDPAARRIATEIELWDLRQSKERRAKHGLI